MNVVTALPTSEPFCHSEPVASQNALNWAAGEPYLHRAEGQLRGWRGRPLGLRTYIRPNGQHTDMAPSLICLCSTLPGAVDDAQRAYQLLSLGTLLQAISGVDRKGMGEHQGWFALAIRRLERDWKWQNDATDLESPMSTPCHFELPNVCK